MKVLVVSPHLDDEVLGPGGAIAAHVGKGDVVDVCFVADRVYDHAPDRVAADEQRRCALDAKQVLGYRNAIFLGLQDERLDACLQDILIPLEKVVADLAPEIAYVPHRGDNNQDHRAVFAAAQVVFRPAVSSVRRLLSYETPSSTEQAPPHAGSAFLPNSWTDISGHLERKLAALACYTREVRAFPHPRSAEAIRALATWRGTTVGFEAAEAFMLLMEKTARPA
jgi:LmbE family N-acetylglucosaminyl deacetylase